MEKIKMTLNKTAEWLNDISTKSGLKKALEYQGIPLWVFYKFELSLLVEDHIKNQNDGINTPKNGGPEFISKFAKYYFTFRAITRSIFGKIISNQIKIKQLGNINTYKILVVSYTTYWKNYPTPQKENKKAGRDAMLGDVVMALKTKKFNLVALDSDTTFFVDFRTMIEKSIQGKGLWRPEETYLTLDIIRKVFKASKRHKKKWDKLKINDKFITALNYDGFQLSTLLPDYFEKLFKYRTFSPVLDIELMKRAIEVEKPDLVLTTCGYCQLGRAATFAGKLKGVPTLEIQHGNIYPSHRGYIHAKDEISPEGSVKSPYCPIPDKTAVYGPYTRDVLTKVSAYPEDSVVITGQPRYDFLYRADEIYNKEKICKDLGIDPNKKLIVVATQGYQPKYGYPDYDRQLLDAVFNSLNDFPGVQLVIKLHPWEDGELQRKMLEERKLKNVLIMKSNLYELLYVCDILIAINSTVATEAMILDKPAIIVNLANIPDWVPYAESGAALGVYKKENLTPAIRDVFENLEVSARLKENRKKFVYEHAYLQDGKSTERVINLISQMIKEKQKV